MIRNVLPLQPAEIVHPLLERRIGFGGTGYRSERHPPDATDGRGRLSLAEPVRDEQADAACQHERAPRDHWITSSARSSIAFGMVIPSAFAVLRLITRSNLVACSTGRSAGLAPFNILSTYFAALR